MTIPHFERDCRPVGRGGRNAARSKSVDGNITVSTRYDGIIIARRRFAVHSCGGLSRSSAALGRLLCNAKYRHYRNVVAIGGSMAAV
jgi:hypothetical protein